MGFLTGRKAKQSVSENTTLPQIRETFTPVTNSGVAANDRISALLGLGGDTEAANQGFQNFQNSSGFRNILDTALRGVSGSAAARGLLRSGSTARALTDRAGQLGQQSFSNYLQQLLGLSGQGLQAGGLIAGAGGRSTGGTAGTPGLISTGLSALSDRRAKKFIRKLVEFSDGLGAYLYYYSEGPDTKTPYLGVMADEVEKLRPYALGPVVQGFKTVNYGRL